MNGFLPAFNDLSLEVASHEGILSALIEELAPGSFVRRELEAAAAKLAAARHAAREKAFTNPQ